MREMHKWKDKVELSLDNRQIFFLFFGLSVIGCFVFALGIMTGRRIDWEPGQEAAALGGQDSLEMLEDEPQGEHFAFQQGLSESDAAAIPPTRDPEVPPRAEDEVRAEREEQAAAQEVVLQREAEAAEVEAKIDEQQAALAQVTPEAAQPRKPATGDGRRFTLQMKAFSNPTDAEKLADKLRHNGHEARIEKHDVRGRTWHRVRLGAFDTWDEALAAKTAFEQAEHVIAYVVSL
jgi:cell division protein FtsN